MPRGPPRVTIPRSTCSEMSVGMVLWDGTVRATEKDYPRSKIHDKV